MEKDSILEEEAAKGDFFRGLQIWAVIHSVGLPDAGEVILEFCNCSFQTEIVVVIKSCFVLECDRVHMRRSKTYLLLRISWGCINLPLPRGSMDR